MFGIVDNKKLALLEMTMVLGSAEPSMVLESGLEYEGKSEVNSLAISMHELENPYPFELVGTVLKMYEDDLITLEELACDSKSTAKILDAYYGLPFKHRLLSPYLVHYTAIDEMCQKAKRSSENVEHIGSLINFIITEEGIRPYLGEKGETFFEFTLKDIEEYTKALATGKYILNAPVIHELNPEEQRRIQSKLDEIEKELEG